MTGARVPYEGEFASPATKVKLREEVVRPGQEHSDAFPEEGAIEYERSVIEIPLFLKVDPKRPVDTMAFDAYMRILRQAPVRNQLGFRQFEFQIDAWELTNVYSKGLNANVTFTLSKTTQPRSICIALQKESDYPAMIVYNAIYDVYLDERPIIENQPGVAVATNVLEIPPRNVLVAFEKPFESETFEFRPGCCKGMRSITREDFEEGAALARSYRQPGRPGRRG